MISNNPSIRQVEEVVSATQSVDGDGVRLLRVFGGNNLARFDPFLMLDEFGSTEPDDYPGGFPDHPHRGFETVTYMVEGSMEHRDHMENVGLLEPGGVQWMTAGAGVIHSEMPRPVDGRLRGFQLWVNLHSTEKMTPATYSEFTAQQIPTWSIEGAQIRIIAGQLTVNGERLVGAVIDRRTKPAYLDIQAGEEPLDLEVQVPEGHTVLMYVYQGRVEVGAKRVTISSQQMARLSRTGEVRLSAAGDSRLLLIAGAPITRRVGWQAGWLPVDCGLCIPDNADLLRRT